jgi:hypothetical protein
MAGFEGDRVSWAKRSLLQAWFQVELYFSIVQRKVLAPNDFDSIETLAERLLRFGEHYHQRPDPSTGH